MSQTQTTDHEDAGPLSRPVLFTEDLAELMNVTPATVRWWASVGRGPRNSRPGGSKRRVYLAEDVRTWLAAERA